MQSAGELASLLNELCAWVIESGGIGLCLHIDCHGCKDGLELADGSQMPWSRLSPLLASINLASGMNLFLWLACCYGGYFVLACRYSEIVPFACIIGPGDEIDPYKLLAFASAFYTELFRTLDITDALTIAGAVRPDIASQLLSGRGLSGRACRPNQGHSARSATADKSGRRTAVRAVPTTVLQNGCRSQESLPTDRYGSQAGHSGHLLKRPAARIPRRYA